MRELAGEARKIAYIEIYVKNRATMCVNTFTFRKKLRL